MSDMSLQMVRKRGAKVNAKQKKILLQFMADNPLIFSRKITADFTAEHHKAFWQNMSAILNIFGPPRKTVESWKKAWKDIKLRYRKVGIDLKEIIGTLKYDNVVDTRMLLEKADQINTLTRGKGDIEEILRETVLAEAECLQFTTTDMDSTQIDDSKLSSLNDICNVKLDGNESVFELASDNEDSRGENKSDENGEEFCEVAYEEVLESDLEGTSDTDDVIDRNSTITKRKDCTKINGVLKNDSDSEVESSKQTPSKKFKFISECPSSSSKAPSTSGCRNESSSSLLNDLLVELRQHNKIQSEKLALKKKHFDQKKKLMEQSLNAKKEIAKAHIMLAKSLKTFVDSISFNT